MNIETNHPGMHYKQNQFTIEASQLGLYHLPKTINLKSHKTGTVLEFYHYKTEIDNEGDVSLYEYRNNQLKLIILND